jgi:5'(3')-deoxyribonucleotidase/uncharacterized protein with PQ loop repeat
MSATAWVALVGGLATICSSFALLPQILRARRDGGRGLSYGMLGLYLAGAVLWLTYGLATGATAVAVANVIATTLVTILIFLKATARPADAAPRKLRIAIDMDETICDILPKHLRLYNEAFGENVTVADLDGRELEDFVPKERAAATEQMILERSFFSDLPVLPNAREVVKELSERHEVFIATAAMDVPTSFDAKYAWLREHLPFIPTTHLIFCGDKGALDMDYLIDDRARHFARFRGQGLLFSAPHNRAETRYTRVNDWAEVRAVLLPPNPAEKAPALGVKAGVLATG